MTITLTLKNIPYAIYERLRVLADAHGSSVESEAINCLDRILLPWRMNTDEHLIRIRELRASLCFVVTSEDIDEIKRNGRQ